MAGKNTVIYAPAHWDLYQDYCPWCGHFVDEGTSFFFGYIVLHTCSLDPEPHWVQRKMHLKCKSDMMETKERCGIDFPILDKISVDMHLPLYERLMK